MRALILPALAVLLVGAVLGVQLAAGGAEYEPRRRADPCLPRPIGSVPARLEPLAEQIVLLGIDRAACRLRTSREALVLSLAENGTPAPEVAPALKAGLGDAVIRLERERRLPRASQLLPQALEQADLPAFVKTLIRALPDSTVDRALPTGPVLRRAVAGLDVQRLLRELDDPDRLEATIQNAVLRAARDEILERLNFG